jgi:hypothetical protein
VNSNYFFLFLFVLVDIDEMGRARNTNWRGIHVGYIWESQKERPLGRPRRRWVDNVKMDFR